MAVYFCIFTHFHGSATRIPTIQVSKQNTPTHQIKLNIRNCVASHSILLIVFKCFLFFYDQTVKLASKNDSSLTKGTGDVNFDESLVVIYNRIPKTGSTSFINLAYDLCKKNKFHVLHINITANMHILSLQNQVDFVRNITHWHEMKPALYHGHMAYLDFSKYYNEAGR